MFTEFQDSYRLDTPILNKHHCVAPAWSLPRPQASRPAPHKLYCRLSLFFWLPLPRPHTIANRSDRNTAPSSRGCVVNGPTTMTCIKRARLFRRLIPPSRRPAVQVAALTYAQRILHVRP